MKMGMVDWNNEGAKMVTQTRICYSRRGVPNRTWIGVPVKDN